MEFQWEVVDEFTLLLIGYECEVIASVYWKKDIECWILESTWLNHNSDFCGDFGLHDVEKVKKEAIDLLKETCMEHIDWYKGQLLELEHVN